MIVESESPGELRQTPLGKMMVLDSNFIQYRTGKWFLAYLYLDLLLFLIEDMRKNIRKLHDNIIVICGDEGSGKSHLAHQICRLFAKIFDIERIYSYNFEEMLDKIDTEGNTDVGKIFWMDEAINVLHKRRWNNEGNKEFVEMLATMRSRGWTLILCIPRFEDLDLYVREHRFRYVIKVEPTAFPNFGFKPRGYFSLERKNPDNGRMEYCGHGMYDPIPEDMEEEYENLKNESQRRLLSGFKDKKEGGSKYKTKYEEERRRIRSAVLSMHEKGISRQNIQEIMGISEENYYKMLRRAKDDKKA